MGDTWGKWLLLVAATMLLATGAFDLLLSALFVVALLSRKHGSA